MIHNNLYTVNPLYNNQLDTGTSDSDVVQSPGSGSGGSGGGGTIIIGGGMTAELKLKLDGILSGAEVNQNAFSNVKIISDNNKIVAATTKTDTLNITGQLPILLTLDESNIIKVSISSEELNKIIAEQIDKSAYWKKDELGNVYTESNVYSTKEISAYGLGTGGGGGTGGAGALYECADVLRDGEKVQGAIRGTLLSYNGTHWYAIPLSDVTPDLTGYATKSWTTSSINTAVNKLIDSAPGTLDTLNEIAAALGDDPNFAATITGLLNTLTIRVTDVENKFATFSDMFEWDKSNNATDPTKWIIKAKRSLFSIGEVSAYGYTSSAEPTGAEYLHELKDVSLTDLLLDQLLKYNGTRWVNVDVNEVGLNETKLAAYLTENGYAKKTDIPSLIGYATESWVTGLKFVKQSVTITTKNGLVGGGDLSSNRVLSLTTVGTAGKYTKVTTDVYGRITHGENVLVTDVVGLLGELDKKLNIDDFNKWFVIEQNTDGSIKSIKALYDFYSVGEVSAYGQGTGEVPTGAQYLHELKDVLLTNLSNGLLLKYNGSKWVNIDLSEVGLNEVLLLLYLTANKYATQTWVSSQGYLTSHQSLTGYATESWVTGKGYLVATTTDKTKWNTAYGWGNHTSAGYLKGITKALVESVLTGNITTHTHDIYVLDTELATTNSAITALKAITITAGAGLTGGGNLTANRTLSLATVGTAGKYTKVTTDVYGRITNGSILLAGDIPVLTISKITGLLDALDSKLNITEIGKWFTIIYNADNSIKSIRANFDFSSVGEISAYGAGEGDAPAGVQYLHELKDVKITDPKDKLALVYDTTLSKWINGSAIPEIDLSNYVTLNTVQTITARKVFLGATFDKVDLQTRPTAQPITVVGIDNDSSNGYLPAIGFLIPGIYLSSIALRRDGNFAFLNSTMGNSVGLVAREFVKVGGAEHHLLRADGGVASFNWVYTAGQPTYVWGGLTQHTYLVYNPANFRVANANTVGDLSISAFARADGVSAQDLNMINGFGIICNRANNIATPDRNYPIQEAGTLFYGTAAYDSANQIYGSFNSNRWFVRGGGSSPTTKTIWRELLHTGNWTSTIDGRYLPLKGGNVTGNVAIAGDFTVVGYSNTNKWFQNNDTGCGLYNVPNDARWYAQSGQWISNKSITATEFYSAGWYRSTGNAGWYSQTYGGGWYMTDSNYIRSYGTKRIHVDSAAADCFNAAGGYHSSWNTSRPDSWVNCLETSYHIFNSPGTGVNAGTIHNILGWADSIINVGYITRYSISSARGNSGWGAMLLSVGNSDAGNSGHALRLYGDGLMLWTDRCEFASDIRSVNGAIYTNHGRIFTGHDAGRSNGISCSNWFASSGNSGWINDTYGGGWYMIDGNHVRTWNDKPVYTGNVEVDAFNARGGFYSSGVNGYGLTIIGTESTTTRISGQIGAGVDAVISRYSVQWYGETAAIDVHRGGSTNITKWSFKHNGNERFIFDVSGNMVASGEVTAYSDVRLKSNIQDLTVRGRLQPKTFIKDNKESIGFIALDILELYPELVLVGTDNNHYLSVNYGAITAVLSALLNTVEDEISVLKNRVRELEDRLYQCERK